MKRSTRMELDSTDQEDYERSLLAHWIPYFVGAGLAVGYLIWVLGSEPYSVGWIMVTLGFAVFPFGLGYLCSCALVSAVIAYALNTGVHVRREYGPVTRLGVAMALVCRGLLEVLLLDVGFFALGDPPVKRSQKRRKRTKQNARPR